jgi:GATA-binding protein
MDDAQFQAQAVSGFTASPGRPASPMNGDRADTQESLLAANASLKTRVSELEVIQELYRGRLLQLETDETNARQAQEKAEAQLRSQLDAATQAEAQLRAELEESHRRENLLKRRLDEVELALKETNPSSEASEGHRAKRLRLDDVVEKSDDIPTAQPAAA